MTLNGKEYTPQQVSAMILQKLKADAEAYLGEPVTRKQVCRASIKGRPVMHIRTVYYKD